MKISMKALVEIINSNTPHFAKIEEVYRDFGQDWKWETIVIYIDGDKHNSYQALCPRDHDKIEGGTFTELDAQDFLNQMIKRGW